jgi:DNA repair ATPase RecN
MTRMTIADIEAAAKARTAPSPAVGERLHQLAVERDEWKDLAQTTLEDTARMQIRAEAAEARLILLGTESDYDSVLRRAVAAEAKLEKARETLGSFVVDVTVLRCALERAREEIEDALACTPSVIVPSVGGPEIIYDRGDPWAILRAARARIAAMEARDE